MDMVSLNPKLMKYIPKEYKKLVKDIKLGEKEYDPEYDKRPHHLLIVEWENGEVSNFHSRTYARDVLKEFHAPEDYAK